MAAMLASPTWQAAHWFAIGGTLITVWGLWLLVDAGWTKTSWLGQAGARLVLLAGLFMAVEFALEETLAAEASAYASGGPVPIGLVVEAMQAIGWPAFMLGFVILIAGVPTSAPAVVRLAGIVGATAMGLGGFLTEGLHIAAAGPLFIGGNLLALWTVWAGVVSARRGLRSLASTQGLGRVEPVLTT
jgi:hypothetical protein